VLTGKTIAMLYIHITEYVGIHLFYKAKEQMSVVSMEGKADISVA
jgi:hypothetical protein